jgi:hypothetical protein
LIESSNEEGEEEEEEDCKREYDKDKMALFIKKRRPYKGERKEKTRSKRMCYNCGKNRHFISQCPYERKKKTITRERNLTMATRKIRNTLRRSLIVKRKLAKNKTQVMRFLGQKVMRW